MYSNQENINIYTEDSEFIFCSEFMFRYTRDSTLSSLLHTQTDLIN